MTCWGQERWKSRPGILWFASLAHARGERGEVWEAWEEWEVKEAWELLEDVPLPPHPSLCSPVTSLRSTVREKPGET